MGNIMENKKLLIIVSLVLVAILIPLFGTGYMSVLFCAVILNGAYLVIQGKIDAEKVGDAANKFKNMLTSKKWLTTMSGNIVALLGTIGGSFMKDKLGFEIPMEWLTAMMAAAAGYVGMQGTKDVKEPEKH